MSTVHMTHPETGGHYDAQPSQVEFLKASRWEVADPDAEYDEWPAELQRFEGQPAFKMTHPEVEGDPIDAAESQVPFYKERGWKVVGEDEAADLENQTVADLREQARDRGLAVSGTKAELIERLSDEGPAHDEPDEDEDQPAAPADKEE